MSREEAEKWAVYDDDGNLIWRPISDEERAENTRAMEQLHRDLEAAKDRPHVRLRHPDKFIGPPPGYRDDGTRQHPLTPEQKRQIEEAERALGIVDDNGLEDGWGGRDDCGEADGERS